MPDIDPEVDDEEVGLPPRLTRGELAKFWRVSTRTIDRWGTDGRCPTPMRIGKRLLWRREDVLAWEARRKKSASG